MKHHAGSPRRAAFLSRTISAALSLPSASCPKGTVRILARSNPSLKPPILLNRSSAWQPGMKTRPKCCAHHDIHGRRAVIHEGPNVRDYPMALARIMIEEWHSAETIGRWPERSYRNLLEIPVKPFRPVLGLRPQRRTSKRWGKYRSCKVRPLKDLGAVMGSIRISFYPDFRGSLGSRSMTIDCW
jgi:hypothetical protein